MTALSILDHPGIFAPTVFVLLMAAIEVGHRMAVISGTAFAGDRREQIASARSALGDSSQPASRFLTGYGSPALRCAQELGHR